MLQITLFSLIISWLATLVLVKSSRCHAHLSSDNDTTGIQKFHAIPVPRIGGLTIFTGATVGVILISFKAQNTYLLPMYIIACSLPAFFTGLVEDLTKKIGPLPRLIATFIAAFLGYFLLDGRISRVDIPLIDSVLNFFWPACLIFTLIAIGGVAHAINIIDGYNGLASVVSSLILLSFSYVCYEVQDYELLSICLVLIASILGFLFFNFPKGLIFSGDGGAYFIGFCIAEIAVLLIARNPIISPWYPFSCLIYPVFETIFSIYRRKFLQKKAIGHPDAMHLHQMIYKRIVRWKVNSHKAHDITTRNSLTSPYLWLISLTIIIPATFSWRSTPELIVYNLIFIFLYILIYKSIVNFKIPNFIKIKSISHHRPPANAANANK